jgi:hypothetical protein
MTAGLIIGIIAYFLQPVRWESSALIALGQIPNIKSQPQPTLIESVLTVTERLKSSSFIADVAKKANRPGVKTLLDKNEGNGLTLKPLKSGDSLIISVTGKSPDLVQIATDSVVSELISRHDSIIYTYRADILREIEKTNMAIASTTKLLSAVQDGRSKQITSDRSDATTGLNIMILLQTLDRDKSRSIALHDAISATNIRPTNLLENTPVTKNKPIRSLLRACLSGALLGALLGIIGVQWKR